MITQPGCTDCSFNAPEQLLVLHGVIKNTAAVATNRHIQGSRFEYVEQLELSVVMVIKHLNHTNKRVVYFAAQEDELQASFYRAQHSPGAFHPQGLYDESEIPEACLRAKLILHDPGGCRFAINGKGAFSLQEIIEKAFVRLDNLA